MEEEQYNVIVVDLDEEDRLKSQCVELANKFIAELDVNQPRYQDITEIEMPHVLSMYCKLMDLNVDDFIPSAVPWKPIDDIIMSLKDSFGAEQFQHLDSMLISVRDPIYLLCLLEIFDTILRFHKEQGKRYDNMQSHSKTMLTNSQMTVASRPRESSRVPVIDPSTLTDMDFNLEILQNDTGDENVAVRQIRQETEKRYKIQVQIPKIPKTPRATNTNSVQIHDRSPNNDVGVNSENEHTTTEEPVTKTDREVHNNVRKIDRKSQQPITDRQVKDIATTRKANSIKSKAELPVDSVNDRTNRTSLVKLIRKLPLSTVPQPKRHIQKDLLSASTSKLPNLSNQLKEKNWETRSSGMKDEKEVNDKSEDNILDADADTAGSRELRGAYDQLQQHLINELVELEAEAYSLMQQDNAKRPVDGKVKYDYFGTPIRERFPYYPSGIIRPRCHENRRKLNKTVNTENGKYCR